MRQYKQNWKFISCPFIEYFFAINRSFQFSTFYFYISNKFIISFFLIDKFDICTMFFQKVIETNPSRVQSNILYNQRRIFFDIIVSAVKKAAEDGSPGILILKAFKLFLPIIEICFFILFCLFSQLQYYFPTYFLYDLYFFLQ